MSKEKSMNLADLQIEKGQSEKEKNIKLKRLHEGDKGTIFNLLKLPDLKVKGINDK